MLKLDIGQSHQNITVRLIRFVVIGKKAPFPSGFFLNKIQIQTLIKQEQ